MEIKRYSSNHLSPWCGHTYAKQLRDERDSSFVSFKNAVYLIASSKKENIKAS